MQPIRLVIVDDHTLICQTWSFILNSDPRFSVVGEAATSEEGIELCKHLKPDVVILDINLPGMNGIEAVPLIRKYSPGTKIMGVSLHKQPVYVKKMIQNGAMGYITKNSGREEMIKGLIEVHLNRKYVCDEIKDILSEMVINKEDDSFRLNALSLREIEIIGFIKQGLSSKEIAVSAHISVKTVEVHRYNILKKLNLRNAAALVNYMNLHSAN